MKYLVLLCDGMADTPNPALGGKTPMECANKPLMDRLAAVSETGICRTVAKGLKPGSDVANLSVMGYDPKVCYTFFFKWRLIASKLSSLISCSILQASATAAVSLTPNILRASAKTLCRS